MYQTLPTAVSIYTTLNVQCIIQQKRNDWHDAWCTEEITTACSLLARPLLLGGVRIAPIFTLHVARHSKAAAVARQPKHGRHNSSA